MRTLLRTIYLEMRRLLLYVAAPFIRKGKRLLQNADVRRILAIRIDGVGDLILTLPAVKALKQKFPSAHITVMTTEVNKDILDGAPFIDETIIYRRGMRCDHLSFDLVFDFYDGYALRTALLAFAVKAECRVGFDVKGRGVFFGLKAKEPDRGRHYVDAMMDLVALVGAVSEDRRPVLESGPSKEGEAAEFLKRNGLSEEDGIICVHPGGKHSTVRWPADNFVRLVDSLCEDRPERIVFVGALYDQTVMERIERQVGDNALFFIGRSLKSVAGLIKRSEVLVCNNSGLLHMACALGVPTVSTMGPTLSEKWWPVGEGHIVLRQDLPCIGCGKGYCRIGTHDCMNKIAVEDMLSAVKKQLERAGGHR